MPTEIESDSRRQPYRREDREQRDRRDRGRRDDRRRDRRSRSRSRSGSRQRSRSRSDSRSRRQERKVHRSEKAKEPVESKHEKNDENHVKAMNEDAPPVPKIEMMENNSGELETSVEQMNILRAKLGLKPLKVESEAEKKQKAEKAKKDEEDRTKERKAIEVKAKIAKAKEEREYKEFVTGKTMGDVLHNQNIYQRQKDSAKKVEQKEQSDHHRQQEQDQLEKLGVKKQDQDQEETEDAASWVLRFRKIQKDKEMAEKREKELEEMEAKIQESATVPGVKVMHNVDDIALKDEVILTLKDDQILENGNLKDGEVVLENVNIAELERTNERLEATKKKHKTTTYNPYSDEKQEILSQYDQKKKENFFHLNQQGQMDLLGAKQAKEMEKKDIGIDLNVETRKASEFLSAEETKKLEIQKFKKKKKTKSTKKKVENDQDEQPQLVVTTTSTDVKTEQLKPMETDNSGKDRGSRYEKSIEVDKKLQELQTSRERAYQRAQEKAQLVNASLVVRKQPDSGGLPPLEDQEMPLILAPSKPRTKSKANDVLQLLAQNKSVSANLVPSDAVELSATAEFVSTIKVESEDLKSLKTKKRKTVVETENLQADVEDHEALLKAVKEKSKKIQEQSRDQEMGEEEEMKENGEENEEDEEGLSFTQDTSFSGGVGALLSVLRTRKDVTPEVFKGRKNDRKVDYSLEAEDPAPEIKLTYTDKRGNPLTAKEAYRELAYKFHNKRPSKNTVAKRERQREEELKKVKMSATDTPLGSAEALRREQEKSQSAFVVIGGGSRGDDEKRK